MNIKYNLSLLSLYNLCFKYTNISELEQKYNYIKDSLDLKLIDFYSSLNLLLEKNILTYENNKINIEQIYKRTLCRYKTTLNFCKKENNCDYIHYIYELKFLCSYRNFIKKNINFANFNKYLLDSFNETIYNKCEKKDDRYQLFIDNRIFYCKFNKNNDKEEEFKKKVVNIFENKREKKSHYNIKKEYLSDEFSSENDNSSFESNYNIENKNLYKKRKREKSSFDRYESNNKYIKYNSTKRKKIEIQILENKKKIKEEEEKLKNIREEKKLRKLLLEKKKLSLNKITNSFSYPFPESKKDPPPPKDCYNSTCNKIRINYLDYCDDCQEVNDFESECNKREE